MDDAEVELFPNKKQAGMPNPGISHWGNIIKFKSATGQFSDRLAETEPGRTSNFEGRNIPSVSDLDMGRKAVDDSLRKDSTFGLSISHNLEDPRSSVRKVKVSQVRDESPISTALAYSRGDENLVLTAHSGTFMSTGQSFSSRDGNTAMGHNAFNEGVDVISLDQGFCKGDDNIISVGQSFSSTDSGSVCVGGDYQGNGGRISVGLSNINGDGNNLSIINYVDKGESNIICFGGYDVNSDANASGRLVQL